EAPDRFAGCRDGSSERWVTGLQENQHLEEKKAVLFPKLGEDSCAFLVEGSKLSQQVIDLILERDLREHADGFGVSESLLQRCQLICGTGRGWRGRLEDNRL